MNKNFAKIILGILGIFWMAFGLYTMIIQPIFNPLVGGTLCLCLGILCLDTCRRINKGA
jgi:hypothetical protein